MSINQAGGAIPCTKHQDMNTEEKRQQAEQYVLDIAEIVANIANTLHDRDYEKNERELRYLSGDVFVLEQLSSLLRYANRFKSLVISK